MQSTEDAVTVINPGLRFNSVRSIAVKLDHGLPSIWILTTHVRLLQEAVVLDPYARSIVGRRQYGQLAQVLLCTTVI